MECLKGINTMLSFFFADFMENQWYMKNALIVFQDLVLIGLLTGWLVA